MSFGCIYGGPCNACMRCQEDEPEFRAWYCLECLDGWNNSGTDFEDIHETGCPTCGSEKICEIEPDNIGV